MLVACRLAGLSALGAHYAGLNARTQFGPQGPSRAKLEARPTVQPEVRRRHSGGTRLRGIREEPCAACYSPLPRLRHSPPPLRPSPPRSCSSIALIATSGGWTTGARTPTPSQPPSWEPAAPASHYGPRYFRLERSRTRPAIVASRLFACSTLARTARRTAPTVAMAFPAAAPKI